MNFLQNCKSRFTLVSHYSIILTNIPAMPMFKFACSRTNRQVFFA